MRKFMYSFTKFNPATGNYFSMPSMVVITRVRHL